MRIGILNSISHIINIVKGWGLPVIIRSIVIGAIDEIQDWKFIKRYFIGKIKSLVIMFGPSNFKEIIIDLNITILVKFIVNIIIQGPQ